MTLQQSLDSQSSDPAEASLAAALEELDREREAVGEFQRLLLPEALLEIPGFEMSPYYRPSEQAGGDYYDVVPLVDGQWGLVMADVSGHGTPAAVIMTVLRTLIHAELPSNRDKSAAEFLQHVNRVMSETCLRDGRFVTMWAAVLDPISRRLTYASAGHNPPRLLREGRVFELDAPSGIPLGVDPSAKYEEAAITLEPGDLLVIYTDGITEAMRPGIDGRELFGTARLDRILSECGTARASDCTQRVTKAIGAFTDDATPTDDQTMLILRATVLVPTTMCDRGLVTKECPTRFQQKETTDECSNEQGWHAGLLPRLGPQARPGLGGSSRLAACPIRERRASGRERTASRTRSAMPVVHALVPRARRDKGRGAMRYNALWLQ